MPKVLNPFAFKLERNEQRFYDLDTKPVYKNGEYKTFRFDNKWYVTCRKNIIVTETTAIPKQLIDALVAGEEPTDYIQRNLLRCVHKDYTYGLECAKKVGFKVESL